MKANPQSAPDVFVREPDHANVDRRFVERWSPRAFLHEPVTDEEVGILFEAARWSPSCFNAQPWRFVYARTPLALGEFQGLLSEGNRKWATAARMLVIVFAQNRFRHNDEPNRWSQFDAGAAWMALALQARELGLDCHAMGGFDEARAYDIANVDRDQFTAMCMIAIGRRGPANSLPEDLRAREKPSDRMPQADFVFERRMR